MPALPATPTGVIGVRLVHSFLADLSTGSTYRIGYTGGPPSSTELAAFGGVIAGHWADILAPFMTTDGGLTEVQCRDLANPGTTIGVAISGAPGSRAGAVTDVERCAVQFFRPDRTYRGARPKLFLPYGTDSDNSNGASWTSGFTTALQIALNAFYAAQAGQIEGSTHLTVPVCVSYFHGFTVVTSGTTGRARNVPTLRTVPLVVGSLGIEVASRFGSQRRRIAAS